MLDPLFKIWSSEVYHQRLLSVLEGRALKLLGNEPIFKNGEANLTNSQVEQRTSYESERSDDGGDQGATPLTTSRKQRVKDNIGAYGIRARRA